jgi:hypothetical protein
MDKSSRLNPQLEKEAVALIDLYRKRALDKQYFVRIRHCIDALDAASVSVWRARQRVIECSVDAEHCEEIEYTLTILDSKLGVTLSQLGQNLETITTDLNNAARAFEFGTAFRVRPRRGAPRVRYIPETRRLIELYEKVTGEKVVFPKQWDKKTGEALQKSTEFLRLSISQIDPSFGTAKAITAIRNALSERKKVQEAIARRKSRLSKSQGARVPSRK